MTSNKVDLTRVPKKPGVYLWKNKYDEIIYVGKAKNLNNRMNQYLKGMLNSYKTSKMLEEIFSYDYVITKTDKEALILERNLIEKYSPLFNIKLRDDKRYPYIQLKLTNKLEASLVYRIKSNRDNAEFFGPFPTGYGARKISNFINRKTTYKDGLPFKGGDLSYWKEKYDIAKSLLKPKSSNIVKTLANEMQLAADNMQYEIAQDLKETINALKIVGESQNVELISNKNIDVLGVVEKGEKLFLELLFYRQGILLSKNEFVVSININKEETLRQFVSQYYKSNIIPDELITNEKFESDMKVTIPVKGNKKKILNHALDNANDNIEMKTRKFIRKEELTLGALEKLKELLNMKKLSHILMIDNSNTNNSLPISAIVSYRNGIKNKSEYKKYNLIHEQRLADVDYMKQGVTRYFNGNNAYPDLFIVDGGKAQVNEVNNLIPKEVNLIGLVKDDKHQTRNIITRNGKSIDIEDDALMNFLRGIQIEVDRFAKASHITKRKTTLEGILYSIKGVGPKTEERLLNHFKTYSSIYNASIEELEKVVSKDLAILIKKSLERR